MPDLENGKEGGADPRGFWILRLLLRLLGGVGMALAALLLGVLGVVLFPPGDLLRRAALPVARAVLGHDGLHIGALDLRPLSHLELRGIWLGPPKGYDLPLLSVRRVVLRHDLASLLRGEVRVQKVQVERPLLRLEMRGGKPNWVAFIEGLSSSSGPPDPAPVKESAKPPQVHARLERVSIIGLGAVLHDGERRVVLDNLHLAAAAALDQGQTRLRLALKLEGRRPGDASLALNLPDPRLEALLKTDLDLDLEVRGRLDRPQARVDLALKVSSDKLITPWKLDPLQLSLRLGAVGDMQKDEARVSRLSLSFNRDRLLLLSGSLAGLSTPRQVELLLERLHLPLDRLAPYVRAFGVGVDFGGQVEVRDLRVQGPVARIKAKKLPELSGQVRMDKVWVRVDQGQSPGAIRVKDLDLALAFSSVDRADQLRGKEILDGLAQLTGQPGKAAPASGSRAPVAVQGRVGLGSFSGLGARVRDLDLRFNAGATLRKLQPSTVGGQVRLRVPRASFTHKDLGTMAASLATDLRVFGDLERQQITLDRLALDLNRLVRVEASGQLTDFSRKAFSGRLELDPVDLEKLRRWLPPGLGSAVASTKLGGSLGLSLKARGRAPTPGTPLLRLPVEVDARANLRGISMMDQKRMVAFTGLSGDLKVKGRPTDLRLSTALNLGALGLPGQGLTVERASLPLSMRMTPRRLKARITLKAGGVIKQDLGLRMRGGQVGVNLDAALPLGRLINRKSARLGRAAVQVDAGFQRLNLALPGNTLRVEKFQSHLDLGFSPAADGVTNVALETRVGEAKHSQQKIHARGFSLQMKHQIAGHGAITLPRPRPRLSGLRVQDHQLLKVASIQGQGITAQGVAITLDSRAAGVSVLPGGKTMVPRASADLSLDLNSVRVRGVLDQPLKRNHLAARIAVQQFNGDSLGRLDIHQVAARFPSRGVQLKAQGAVVDPLPLRPGSLPRFHLDLDAGLDNPPTHKRDQSTLLFKKIQGAGKLGLNLRLQHSGNNRLHTSGRLWAKAFDLWMGAQGRTATGSRLHLRGLDGDVPFTQKVVLRLPRWWLPRPKRTIFEGASASVLYDVMRPYTKRGASLALEGVTQDEQLGAIQRQTRIGRTSLDLTVADNALRLKRLYMKIFGGDIVGAVEAQVISLLPLDVLLRARTQITGVNLAYLDREAKEHTPDTEVSAMLDLKYRPAQESLEGRINITRLSLDMLDAMLAYLDPNKKNKSVQSNRELINAWYTEWINPRVKLVSIWVSHGNLNMDIELDAWFVAGVVLKRVLHNMRIRRLNILPILRQEVRPLLRVVEKKLKKMGQRGSKP